MASSLSGINDERYRPELKGKSNLGTIESCVYASLDVLAAVFGRGKSRLLTPAKEISPSISVASLAQR